MTPDKKTPLSTDSYKGVRDFYPEDMFFQNYLFETMRRVCESFGYLEYTASLLEPTELYLGKTSEEIVNDQTYTFEDRGGRSVTLRPEMTPSVTRMVAAKRRELPMPARLYSIANMFRYERPQRGRVREFWQLNVDLFGAATLLADTEIITVAYTLMKALGANDDDFVIKLASRQALHGLADELGLDSTQRNNFFALLDRKEKMDADEFAKELASFGATVDVLTREMPEDVKELLAQLEALGIRNAVYNPTVVRGFDYYTGTIFEIFDTNTENARSIFGGGRYDNLLEVFGADHTPAVGFGMGDVTIRDFLTTHNLLPEYVPTTTLFIATTDATYIPEAMRIAQKLREQDIPTAVNMLDKKLGDQLKAADKMRIPFAFCIGETEVASKEYKVKSLGTGVETTVPEDELAEYLWSQDVE